jgi:electron-transferring-flavoprotein dehydrogenase
MLEGGKRIAFGARALIEGGIQSLPKMHMPGALLIGCDAGTLNMPKIKGSHTAMKSGIIAAETIIENIKNKTDLSIYESKFRSSWAYKELHKARNVKPSFSWGLIVGILFTGLDQILFRGILPFTLKHKHADHETLKPASKMPKIEYPKPDGKISFDKTSSVYLTGTNHTENQPVHLQLKDASLPINYTLKKYDEPAQRYCPVGVYEVLRDKDEKSPKFVINSQNCIHCKTCDIKEPSQNIIWVVPEGGGGPKYGNM